MPQQYASVRAEHQAVRTEAGLFDVSHMGRFVVRGAGAGELLQRTLTNDVSLLRPGRALYSLICREDGGILDDLVVYRRDDDWLVVVNAANRDKDLAWLRDHAPSGAEVSDVSEELCLLALQGPKAEALLPVEGVDSTSLPAFGCAWGGVAGVRAFFSRTGYTGEDGFEIFAPGELGGRVWDALVAAGAVPCGLACRDVCRLEAGLRLYGSDMDVRTNPYEAGLGWTVKLDKGDFVGRRALADLKATGVARRLAGISASGHIIPRRSATVRREGEPIGEVTSGTYSFWLARGIGFARLAAAAVVPGTRVSVETHGGPGAAEVVALPFYRGSVKKPEPRAPGPPPGRPKAIP
jgi:aminomethyltransferase